ncbi:phosphoglucosamine mutase [Actinopolyspora mortivallis]|uniref:Phosphoglucosamine mutase n=1 Tax=Actinopolyspora mortivallis TaxID=33906 RepID=A0A2T0GVH2_ACTMO|nr:phosphoglucosamine mutase [Actinopolyspora mortivallis]PRW63115.1 phosphoglucosamine mutase [Actinopolyspora mortivallis]
MSRLFGTDGVRGLANADLGPELAMSLAATAARVLYERDDSRRRVALVGRDPRVSGEMLDAAVTAGLTSAGADVVRVGVMPTPAVAQLVADTGADLGVMISASHNPMPDNGIKLFAAGGHKLADAIEDEIAARLDENPERPTGEHVGRVREMPEALDRYVTHLLGAVRTSLDGLRVVVDCAHGAAAGVAPEAYRRAGAEVIPLHAEPDGVNINDGVGSTRPELLQRAVVEHAADLGVAHDGDADRCMAVDATGELVDGDRILAVLALAMRDSGELTEDTVVATVMSNLGLHLAMREHGLKLRTTAVGDRYVLEELRSGGFALGGEQSGHIVFPEYATTGDGLLTALRLMDRMVRTGSSLAELASVMTRMPQSLVNVSVADKTAAVNAPAVAEAVANAEAELGEQGRVLLRPSGTEQLVRVMVEAPTADRARITAEQLAEIVGSIR